jgi:hypothetical protein
MSRQRDSGLVTWWRTPKLYPNGYSFTPRDHVFGTCICLALIALCLVLLWLTMQALNEVVTRVLHAVAAK